MFAGNITGNISVGGANTQVLFNTNGNVDAVGGMTFDKGPNLFTILGTISSQGNTIAGNLLTAGVMSATGNVTANYFIGNGSQLTGLSATYGNSNVASYLPTYTGNISSGNITATSRISASGNVYAANILTNNYLYANGVVFTGNYGNSNVANYLPTYSGLVSGTLTTAVQSNITTIGTQSALSVSGTINSGNINAGNITGVSVSVTGNTIAGNIISTGIASISQTITGGNIVSNGYITTVGNVYANYFVGSLSGTVSNATYADTAGTANTVSNNTQANITSVGVLTFLSVSGNITSGNLTLNSASGNIIAHDITSGGNITTNGFVSAVGNITGGNLTLNSATGNVIAHDISLGGNLILSSTVGNIIVHDVTSGGNITATGLISATGNLYGSQLSVSTGTITAGNIINANANGVGNIGNSINYFNTVFAKATSAVYADLAESYLADADYVPGTVVSFGGMEEITQSSQDLDVTIAGIVSTNPAYQMNSQLQGRHVVTVALVGRVPCRVTGSVTKGAMMVSAGDGTARAEANPVMGSVIGKALESCDAETGIIEIVVGRL